MPLHVLVAEEARRINSVNDAFVITEARVKRAEVVWLQSMRLCPMRPSSIPGNDVLERPKQRSVRRIEAIRSDRPFWLAIHENELERLLEFNQPNPARLLPITRAQPDVVTRRKSNFNGKVGPHATRLHAFFLPISVYF